jgi:hypothetical protein
MKSILGTKIKEKNQLGHRANLDNKKAIIDLKK